MNATLTEKAGARIVGSRIRGPVVIGAGTLVEQSFVGPFTAIGRECEILHSEIEHSVVLERSRIVEIPRIEDSLIGKEVEVSRSKTRPRALRIMVGDHCKIDVE